MGRMACLKLKTPFVLSLSKGIFTGLFDSFSLSTKLISTVFGIKRLSKCHFYLCSFHYLFAVTFAKAG